MPARAAAQRHNHISRKRKHLPDHVQLQRHSANHGDRDPLRDFYGRYRGLVPRRQCVPEGDSDRSQRGVASMDAELKNLKIDRTQRRSSGQPSKWATRWIIVGVLVLLLLGAWNLISSKVNAATEVQIQRVTSTT